LKSAKNSENKWPRNQIKMAEGIKGRLKQGAKCSKKMSWEDLDAEKISYFQISNSFKIKTKKSRKFRRVFFQRILKQKNLILSRWN
jgi:hypothetical protein